jgi:SRSO17 transposase
MSLLDHPEARALLADAEVSPDDVQGCHDHLQGFLQRYLPLFARQQQREHAGTFVGGLLSGLERKSIEPIAAQAGLPRKNLQSFVGAGAWDDQAVTAELRQHVAEELAEPDGIIVLDPSGLPKKGQDSCGVARQWCGRLGKKDHGQIGVFLSYVSSQGHAPLEAQLDLPKPWADDPERRAATHVPEDLEYRSTWQIAHELLRRCTSDVPHRWVLGDDEFGRASPLRHRLRGDRERYLLDVPCHTTVRDLNRRRPPRRDGRRGGGRAVPFMRVDAWAAALPAERWTRLTVRDGTKGPMEVEAVTTRVCAKLGRRIGPEERLLIVRTLGPESKTTYCLSNAPRRVSLAELVRVHAQRHRVERVLQEAKGEVGLAHDEVRSWVGWHQHITLALLALWFLILERQRLGGENPGRDRLASARDLQQTAPQAVRDAGRDCRRDQPGLAA